MCIHICLIHKMHLERHCKITHWLPLGKELLGTGIKGRFFSLVESWINIFKIQRLDGKLADKIANIIKSSTQQLEISLELQIQSKKCLLNISQGLVLFSWQEFNTHLLDGWEVKWIYTIQT